MKTLVVYFDDEEKMGYPFGVREYYLSYCAFSRLCAQQNVRMIIVRGANQYLGGMTFASGWEYEAEELHRVSELITADVVYMKGTHLRMDAGSSVVNSPELTEICKDKFKTYTYFAEYMAPTFLLTLENATEVIAKITTEQVVIKPVSGTEGRGIIIVPTQDFSPDMLEKNQPYIAQEFLDSSAGMPGIMIGRHDLRMYIYNGAPRFAEYREPKKGGLLANIAQGGSLTVLDVSVLPQWALDMVPRIDVLFQSYYPRMYTIDLLYANNRPYLVELNSQPGMPYPEWSFFDEMQRVVFDTLMSATTST